MPSFADVPKIEIVCAFFLISKKFRLARDVIIPFSSSALHLTSGTRRVVAALLVASVAAVRLSVAEEVAGDAAAVGDALRKID